jgi:type 2 lantibiotic biosynthesis protein LanM
MHKVNRADTKAMLAKSDYATIAAKASNVSEQIRTVLALGNNFSSALENTIDLQTTTKWRQEKFLSKLALMQIQEATFKGHNSFIPDVDELRRTLSQFGIITDHLSDIASIACDVICDLHQEWLDYYGEAIGALSSLDGSLDTAWWEKEDVYYDAGAIVIKPFLILLKQKISKVCAELSDMHQVDFDSHIIHAKVQSHYISRFRLMIARALEAEIKAEQISATLDEAESREGFRHFLDKTFSTESDYHNFFINFPVLARWLAVYTQNICRHIASLLNDLGTDKGDLSIELLQGSAIARVSNLEIGQSDPHNKCRSVAIIQVETRQQTGEVRSSLIVYKPRCVGLEKGLQSLLREISQYTSVKYRTYDVINKCDHGWCSFLLANGNQASEHQSVDQFFSQLGGYLAIGYALGSSDLHYENIIASDLNAFICDAETLIDIVPEGMTEASSLFDSVFKTGLLEWPRYNDKDTWLDISGISGGDSYRSPAPTPVIDNPGSLSLRVISKQDCFISSSPGNKITLNGTSVLPSNHRDAVIHGFDTVFNWLSTGSTNSTDSIVDHFRNAYARFVNRSTQIYASLMSASEHAKCLRDPLEVDLVFYSLIRYPCHWDSTGILSSLEFTALWGLDIPLFSARVDQTYLLFDGKEVNKKLSISAVDNVRTRLSRLCESARMRQNRYILASLSRPSDDTAEFNECCIDYACMIADTICQSITEDKLSPWPTVEYWAGGKQVVPVDGSLYNGSSGISLFLAYINKFSEKGIYKDAAVLGLEHSRKQFSRKQLGTFQGGFGLVYLLTHLGVLWDNDELLYEAKDYALELSDAIQSDDIFDIIQGAAGAIPTLLALSKLLEDSDCLELAQRCGLHLVDRADKNSIGISWSAPDSRGTSNLTGFSHGTAGIGWSLILLGHELDDNSFISRGLDAFKYEQSKFDIQARNWLDLRQSVASKNTDESRFSYYWCSGSTGIGLSRISAWSMLGEEYHSGLQQASMALEATLGSFGKLDNDCLCHGKAGSAELVLRYGLLTSNSKLVMEARIQAMEMWSSFERKKAWSSGLSVNDFIPGLMLGLSGIGLHFLRLAYPELIPSPLLLDSPHQS